MALMRVSIDKRTIAGLASAGTATYAHGLPGIPDVVRIRFTNAGITATTAWVLIRAPVDATNVTLQNCGAGAGTDMEVDAMVFHSLIQ
jgi:hypothetical protein